MELRLSKQLEKERVFKTSRALTRLSELFESKYECKPDVLLRRTMVKWAGLAQLRMHFSKASKYLYEIDISRNEKSELEAKIGTLNEENEAL